MPFSWDDMPYTNFHELNLDWFINKFKEIFEEWESLYNQLTTWKDTTDAELEAWKTAREADIESWETATLAALDTWKTATETDIGTWETATIAALDTWKTAAEAAFEAIQVQAAASATAAAGSATTAETAKTAAIAAQTAAETAAESVTESAAQIATNTEDISELKTQLNHGKTATPGYILTATNDGNGTKWSPVGLPTDEQTAEAVSDWLDEHPEATTTVQDGSLTEVKFSDSLKIKTIKDYITPQMYGAVGDGVADDYTAFQTAIDTGKTVVVPSGTYKLSHSINIHTGTEIIGVGNPDLVFDGSGIVAEDTYYRNVLIKGLTIHASYPIDFRLMKHSISESEFSDLMLYGDDFCISAPSNGMGSVYGHAVFNCTFENILLNSNNKGICNIALQPQCKFIDIYDGGHIITPFYNVAGEFMHCNIGFSDSIEDVFLFDGNVVYYGMKLGIEICNFELIKKSLIKCTSSSLGFHYISIINSEIAFDIGETGITDPMITIYNAQSIRCVNINISQFTQTHASGYKHISANIASNNFPNIDVPNDFIIYSTSLNTDINYQNKTNAGFRNNDAMQSFYAIKAEYSVLSNLGIKKDVTQTANNLLLVPYCTCANITSAANSTIYTMRSEKTHPITGKSAFEAGYVLTVINNTANTLNFNYLNDTTDNGFVENQAVTAGESIVFVAIMKNGYRLWKKIG